MKLKVHWNQNLYTIIDVDVKDPKGKLIVKDNMWDHEWARVHKDFGGDADGFVIDLHKDAIQRYVETGLTIEDDYILGSGQTLTVPARRISPKDAEKYFTINIHLGKGIEGARRVQVLKALAAEAGYYWNGEPSIGRWLSAVADEKLKPCSRPSPTPDVMTRIKALAEGQVRIWQDIIKELGGISTFL